MKNLIYHYFSLQTDIMLCPLPPFHHFICSNITDAHAEKTIPPPAMVLASLRVALLQANLVWIPYLRHSPTAIALVHMLWARWFKNWHGLGLGYFVKESKVCYIFA